MKFLLLQKRTGYSLTWLGKLLTLFIACGTAMTLFFNLYAFLAPTAPLNKGLLVVEGWLPDYAIYEVLKIYRSGNYEKIITTGMPVDTGGMLSKWKSFPQMTTARLIKMKIDPTKILTVVGQDIRRDRTYASAIAMKKHLITAGINQTSIHLVSLGPHGRRSQLLYRKALGENYSVGITSLEDQRYQAERWWSSSNGFRSVISELIAYVYAKFLFHP